MSQNLPAIRKQLTSHNMQESIRQRIGDKAGTFTTSLLDIIGETSKLQQCNVNLVVKEALKAASLDLPINKSLGFAYIIPYKENREENGQWVTELVPAFQLGYKGFVQLAIRTGQYKHLNAGVVYEGEEIIEDRIKGTVQIKGNKKSDKAIGYFAYMQLINGFEKAVAWTREKVEAHAKRFSKSYSSKTSPWKTDFDAMAMKTMILQIRNYMPMTIEMSQAMVADQADYQSRVDYDSHDANSEVIDIDQDEMPGEEKAEIQEQEAKEDEAPY